MSHVFVDFKLRPWDGFSSVLAVFNRQQIIICAITPELGRRFVAPVRYDRQHLR